MTTIDLLSSMTAYAKIYNKQAQSSLVRNNHMNELQKDEVVDKKHIEAVLVDFINFIGVKNSVDYALYTEDLQE